MSVVKTTINWRDGVHFRAETASGHVVEVDGPPDLGGSNSGARPMEHLLVGIAGCSATDVVYILARGRMRVLACTVEASGERSEEEPQVFTDIHLHFRVKATKLTAEKLERAIQLSSDTYCSASILMRRAGVNVTHSSELVK